MYEKNSESVLFMLQAMHYFYLLHAVFFYVECGIPNLINRCWLSTTTNNPVNSKRKSESTACPLPTRGERFTSSSQKSRRKNSPSFLFILFSMYNDHLKSSDRSILRNNQGKEIETCTTCTY